MRAFFPSGDVTRRGARATLQVAIEQVADNYLTGRAFYASRPDLAVLLNARVGSTHLRVLAVPAADGVPGHAFHIGLPNFPMTERVEIFPVWGGQALLRGTVVGRKGAAAPRWLPDPLPPPESERMHTEGEVLAVYAGHLVGWARHPARPGPVLLDILVDGSLRTVVRTGAAHRVTRPNVDEAGWRASRSPLDGLARPARSHCGLPPPAQRLAGPTERYPTRQALRRL